MTNSVIKIDNKSIGLVLKAIKFLKPELSKISIQYIGNDSLSLTATDGINTVKINNIKVIGEKTKPFAYNLNFLEFKLLLERSQLSSSSLKIEEFGSSIRAKIGKLSVILTTLSFIPYATMEEYSIGDISLSSLHSIRLGLGPLAVNNSVIVALKEENLIGLDSVHRTLILLRKLTNKLPAKLKLKNNIEIPFSLGFNLKEFDFIQNTVLACASKLQNIDNIPMYAVGMKDSVTQFKLHLIDPNGNIEVFTRILDENSYTKETAIIQHCNGFSTKYSFTVSALDLAVSISSSKIIGVENIVLSNPTIPTSLVVKARYGNFSDFVDIKANCKFQVSTFALNLSKILSDVSGPTEVVISLHEKLPIISINCSPNIYFVSCLNTTEDPYVVKEQKAIKNEDTMVGKGT